MYTFEDVFSSSEEYAGRFSGEVGAWLLSVQKFAILGVLRAAKVQPGRILDVGGGHGQLIEVAESLGADLSVAVSHTDALLNLEQRAPAASLKIRFEGIVSDLLALPVANKSFPLVSCVRLLSHTDQWRLLIQELCRVSANMVVVDYPPLVSGNILYRILFPLKRKLEGNTRTFTIFSHQEIRAAFEEQGYEQVKRRGQFFLPMVLHRKMAALPLSRLLECIAKLFGLSALFGSPTIALFKRKT